MIVRIQMLIACLTLNLFSIGSLNELKAAQLDGLSMIRLEFHCPAYSDRELREFAGTGSILYSAEELPELLEGLYHALALEGYPLTRLDSVVIHSDAQGDVLELFISTGKPVTLNSGRINGLDDTSRSFRSSGRLTEGAILSQVDEILTELTDDGFPFAKVIVIPDSVYEDSETISTSLDFCVDRGSFIRLRRIEFPGAVLTQSRLLRLESRLRSRDVFSRTKLKQALKRLERLPYIDYVGEPRLVEAGAGLINLQIPVSERRVNRLAGVLSTAPGRDKPTGEVRIYFGNILGTGRKLKAEWLGLDPTRRGILVSYREPWILGYPWHAVLELEQWMEDTLNTTTRYEFGLEWEPSDRLIFTGSVASERIGGGNDSAITESGSHSIWIEGGIGYDRFDHTWNPERGFGANISSAAGFRRWDDSDRDDSRLRHETATVSAAQLLFKNLVLFERFETRDVSGTGIVLEELVRIGGIGTIRGYTESVILARGACWGSAELRWRPDRDGYLGLFGDVGYIYRKDERIIPRKEIPVSFGLTAVLMTKAGKLGLDMALATGEPLRNARLHVRLEGWF